MPIRIPDTFLKKIKALPLKFYTTGQGLAGYMKDALTQDPTRTGELLGWSEELGDKAVLTYTAYTYKGWVFVPCNGYGEPWSWRQPNSYLGWGIFKRPDLPQTASLDEAIDQFDTFHNDLRANIGLNDSKH